MKLKEIKTELRNKVHDFATKIQPLYRWLGWTWYRDGKYVIPTMQDIENNLHEKIDGLEGKIVSIRSGGLCVWIDKDNASAGIEFKVSEEVYW